MKWLYIIQGIVAILFGLLAFAWPGLTLRILVILVGLYLFTMGIVALLIGITSVKENKNWWLIVVEGLLGILAGVITFTTPAVPAIFLFFLVLAWAFTIGLLRVVIAFQMRKENAQWWLLGLGGLAALLIGFMLIFAPIQGLIVVAWVIGFYAIFSGVATIGYAFSE